MIESGQPHQGKRHSAEMTEGPSRAPARAMLRAIGFSREDLSRPINAGLLHGDAVTVDGRSIAEIASAAVATPETGGFCKIVSNQQNDILGIHLIGPEVTELVYAGGLGVLLEATPYEMGRAMAPHPTLSEVLMEAGLAATSGAIHF